jgi:hypothetical protein
MLIGKPNLRLQVKKPVPVDNLPVEMPGLNRWLKRSSRISAWVLLVGIIILVITGWGITHTGIVYNFTFGLIDRRLADFVHRTINIPLAFFFLSHVLLNIRLALSRKKWANSCSINSILIIIGAALFAVVLYIEYWA